MINVEITRNPNENALGVLRRFSRKVQSSGVINRVRSIRYASRIQSSYKVKQRTLKTIARKDATALLIKQGKAPVKSPRGSRR